MQTQVEDEQRLRGETQEQLTAVEKRISLVQAEKEEILHTLEAVSNK